MLKLKPAGRTSSIVEESLCSKAETKVSCPKNQGTETGSLVFKFPQISQTANEGNQVQLILRGNLSLVGINGRCRLATVQSNRQVHALRAAVVQ